MSYYDKYLKYKNKYLDLKKQLGGKPELPILKGLTGEKCNELLSTRQYCRARMEDGSYNEENDYKDITNCERINNKTHKTQIDNYCMDTYKDDSEIIKMTKNEETYIHNLKDQQKKIK
jgi:hypothetical protein